jgi:heme oxygenase
VTCRVAKSSKTSPAGPWACRQGEGTAFYDFEQIPHEGKFKQRYRAQLDALGLDQATIDRIVAEANYAFKLNMDSV